MFFIHCLLEVANLNLPSTKVYNNETSVLKKEQKREIKKFWKIFE